MSRGARGVLRAVAVVALVCAGALAWAAARPGAPDGSAVLTDLDGRSVALDAAPTPAGPGSRVVGRFQAPAQQLDVALRTMSAPGTVVSPPSLTEAFVVTSVAGDPVGPGRVVVLHAVQGGRAPGNALVGTGVAVRAGDPLVVDGTRYRVVETLVVDKGDAGSAWARAADPGALVVLTCLPRTGTAGAATQNLVVHAVRA